MNNSHISFLNKHETSARGFSLIEVVLALGVAAFGLIAVISLFSSSLQSNNEVVIQQEVFGVTKELPDFLQNATDSTLSGSPSPGFPTVFAWLQKDPDPSSASATPAPYVFAYAYTLPVPTPAQGGATSYSNGPTQTVVRAWNDTRLSTEPAFAQGRIFALTFYPSPNLPIPVATSPATSPAATPIASPIPSQLKTIGVAPSTTVGDASATLAIQAKLYVIPQIPSSRASLATPPPNAPLALIYDTNVNR